MFVLHLCGHSINDTNGSEGVGYVRWPYKDCSHIDTNLGPHRAQT